MAKEVMHQQFYYKILNKIKTGELKNGEKLPAERTYCDIYGISRTTVREALRKLETEGYVNRKQGSGSYVQLKPLQQNLAKLYTLRNMFADQGIKHEVKMLAYSIIACSEETGKNLELPIDSEIIKIVRLFLAADVPYTIEYTYLPRALFPELTQDMVVDNGLYSTLESFGKKPTAAKEIIRAVCITDEQKELLKLPEDVLVIETKRLTRSDGDVIEYTKNTIRNDYFVYTVNLE